jgi:DNA-binding transcriptional LysR family regulator
MAVGRSPDPWPDRGLGQAAIVANRPFLKSSIAWRISAWLFITKGIEVHLEGTNRRVDVVSEGFDIAIRVRFPPLAPSDLVMRQLDQSTQCLLASPALVAQALMSPADLVGLPSLDLGPPHREHVWQLRHEDGRTADGSAHSPPGH